MNVSKTCILCRKNVADTKEHFIPQVIGGRLGVKILCNNCNNNYGSLLLKTYKTEPKIKIALESLKNTLPKLYDGYIKNSSFVGYDDNNKEVRMKVNKKGLYIKTLKSDGIIIDTRKAPKILKSIIKKHEDKEIIEPKALSSLIGTLPDDILIPVTQNLGIRKKSIKRITPALNTNPLEPRAILLAVYEFLYLCCFGESILEDRFDFIRNSILSGKIDSRIKIDSFYTRRNYLPYHMLICDKGEKLNIKFVIFNAIYNTVSIEGVKVINNNGYIFIDHLLEKKFYYNNI